MLNNKHKILFSTALNIGQCVFVAECFASIKNANIPIIVNDIQFVIHPIFDESADDVFFLHQWANTFHINTRESTIRNLLPIQKGSQVDEDSLKEIERLLRVQHFLRDSKIKVLNPKQNKDKSKTIVIETWDNWSLLPTVSLGRSGGESKFAIGFKEDNFWGTGIKSKFNYKSNDERSGYKFAINSPIKWFERARLSAGYSSNTDGSSVRLNFNKPFQLLNDKEMFSVNYLDDHHYTTLRQNGEKVDVFKDYFKVNQIKYGQLLKKNDHNYYRMVLGINQIKHEFCRIEDTESIKFKDNKLPNDRDFLYPWLAFNFIEADYRVLNNINLINFNEDFNIGLQFSAQIGAELNDIENNSIGYHISGEISKGIKWENKLLLLSANFNSTLNTIHKDSYLMALQVDYFHHITNKWTYYNKFRLISSKNNFIDRPLNLGDSNGIRGYPNSYQYGDQQWLITTEIRNYPNINIYQLADLGWAGFLDIGQSFGHNNHNNAIKTPIGSIGIGARLYSSRSSFGNVIHIDLSTPLKNGVNVNNVEWRIQIKNHF